MFHIIGIGLCGGTLLYAISCIFVACLSVFWVNSLAGEGIVITGCDSGFGRLTALKLAQEHGAKVFAGCLTKEGAESLHQESGGKIFTHTLDVTDQDSVDAFYDQVLCKLGSDPLYAVLNNAGGSLGWYTELTPIQTFQKAMDVNYLGVVRVTKKFLPPLLESQGRLLTVTSCLTLVASAGIGPYTCSKVAAGYFMDSLRKELRSFGLKVIQICPGFTATPFVQKAMTSMFGCYESSPEVVRRRYKGHADRVTWLSQNAFRYLQGKPEDVVDVIVLALRNRLFRRKYFVGYDTFLLWKPIAMLPGWLQDAASALTLSTI